MKAFSSLRVRLIGLLIAVVVTAMGVVFLYVVPTLRANLIAQRLDTLAKVALTQQQNARLTNAVEAGNLQATQPAVDRAGRLAIAHVVAFTLKNGRITPLSQSDIEPLYTVQPVAREAIGA